MKTVSDRIAKIRKSLGLTQLQMAKKIGVSRPAVAQWESGDSKSIRPENLFKIENMLGVSAEWLATGKGSEFVTKVSEKTSTYDGQDPLLALIDHYKLLTPERRIQLREYAANLVAKQVISTNKKADNHKKTG